MPKASGVYAWYFQVIPPQVPTAQCHTYNGLTLLYIGISPKKPPQNGKPPSGIQLRRVGSGARMTFAQGERVLDTWLEQNAYISWMHHPQPWLLEEELIRKLSLPLNLDQNNHHAFHDALAQLRATARIQAQALPVINPT